MNSNLIKQTILLFVGIFFSLSVIAQAQIVVYEQDWEDLNTWNTWNYNTANFWIGSVAVGENQWIVNNEYLGASGVIPDTDPQIAPITNAPNSFYLHTVTDTLSALGVNNCNYTDFLFSLNPFLFPETISAEMGVNISTVGLTDVTLDFWWLCGDTDPGFAMMGGAQLWFSTDGGITWGLAPNVSPNNFLNSPLFGNFGWQQTSVTHPANAWDNQPNLRFAIAFTNALGGLDPKGFALDEFLVTATGPCSIDLGPDQILCLDDTLQYDFTSMSSNTLYNWSDGNTTAINNFTQAGTYWLEVIDTTLNCVDSDTVVVTQNPTLVIDSVLTTEPSSCGSADASIEIFVSGGTPNYNFSINGGLNFIPINNFNGLLAGSYDIVIEDAANCQQFLSTININDPSPIIINQEVLTPMGCNSLGQIEIIASGGGNPLSYSIDGGITFSPNNIFPNLGVGVYDIEVREGLCVELGGTHILTDPTIVIDSVNTMNGLCNSLSQGEIEIFATGVTGVINYSIDGGVNTSLNSLFTGLNPGGYDILIDDGICTDATTVTLSEPNSLVVDAFVLGGLNNVGITCHGDSTGSLYTQVFGGMEPYTYNWLDQGLNSFGALNSDTINGVGAGFYYIQIIDDNGCIEFDTVSIYSNDPIQSVISTDSVSCFGYADGSAMIDNVIGGIAPYNYQWSNGDTNSLATNLPAGSVWVLIQDDYACQVYDTAFIEEPYLLEVNALANPVTCYDYDDGELTAAPFNGTAPYTYVWSYPGYGIVGSTQTITGLQPSMNYHYYVEVTDAKGCTAIDTAWIDEPDELDVFVTANTLPAYCVGLDYGDNTGFASVQTIGGNPDLNGNYNYVWAAEPSLSFPGLWDSYLDDQSSIAGVNPGYYQVVSTDYKGCVDTVQVVIPLQETMDIVITSENNVCFQGADGSATAFGFGGCGQNDPFDCDYMFEWSTPTGVLIFYGEDAQISNLSEGIYSVTVTDTNDCSVTQSVYIDEPDEITMSIVATDQSCYGGTPSNDGSIYVDVQGGLNPSYTLDWYDYSGSFPGVLLGSNLISDNYLITGLSSGEYNLEVSDTNGCIGVVDFSSQETNPVEIEQGYQVGVEINPDPSVLDIILDCYNLANGSAEVLSPDVNLTYTWYINNVAIPDTGASTNSLGVPGFVPGGSANVTVVASYNGLCETVSLPVTIQNPNAININANVLDESCVGANDGSIVIPNLYNGISGGVPFGNWTNPYVLNWNPASSANPGIFNLQNLSPGSYTVGISDANNCVYPIEFIINPADPMTVNVTNPNDATFNGYWIDCSGNNTGLAFADISGGETPYTISWSNGAPTNLNPANNLSAGIYSVQVTDDNGCIEMASFDVTEPQPLELFASNSINISCNGSNDGSVTLNALGGVVGDINIQGNPALTGNFYNFSGLLPGINTFTVTDDNGCVSSVNVEIIEPALLVIDPLITSLYGSFEISCFGLTDGVITASSTGGTTDANGNLNYTLSGDGNNFAQGSPIVNFTDLAIGNYTVTVTDANGCTDVSPVSTLTQPDELTALYTTNYTVPELPPFVLDFQNLSQPTPISASTPASAITTLEWYVNGAYEVFGPGNFTNTESFTFYSMGEYEVTLVVTNNNGLCSDEYTEYFTVQGLSENNVFSPNGDNINDYFSFDNYGLLEMEVSFYNRWGDKVYEMFEPDSKWDGVSMNGQEVPEGVYFYVLTAKGLDGSAYDERGSVTIYR